MKSAVIISNGFICDYEKIKKYCIGRDVLCADGAFEHCIKLGILPDVWIGDFDSCNIDVSDLKKYSDKTRIIRLNPEKDMTDTEYICDFAVENGYDDVILLGATGTRFDHTLANVYVMKKLHDKGVNVKIINENNLIYIAKKHNELSENEFKYVSLLPLSDYITGVITKGLKYTLDNAVVCKYSSLGVSNQITENDAYIDIADGDALIILSKD